MSPVPSPVQTSESHGQTHLPDLHFSTARFCKQTPTVSFFIFLQHSACARFVTPLCFVELTKVCSYVNRLDTQRKNKGKHSEGTGGCWVNNTRASWLRHDYQPFFTEKLILNHKAQLFILFDQMWRLKVITIGRIFSNQSNQDFFQAFSSYPHRILKKKRYKFQVLDTSKPSSLFPV